MCSCNIYKYKYLYGAQYRGQQPGDNMKFLRRFWRKTKVFSMIVLQGIEEGGRRRAEWYIKNRTYID